MLVFRRFAHNCVACGSALVAPLSRSTAPQAGSTPSVRGSADRRLSEILGQLSPEQTAALSGEPGSSELGDNTVSAVALRQQLSQKTRQAAAKSAVCKPCVMARAGTITPVQPSLAPHKEQLGRKFHIVDALDFPLGVPDLRTVPGGDVFVVNRCDLLVSHSSQLPRLKKYIMEHFAAHGIGSDRVVLTSAARGWHLQKLSELFLGKPKRNYFVGPTNAGKTRLAHAMCGITGQTTWALPFTTQHALEHRTLREFRAKPLVDCPSTPAGSTALGELLPTVLRKTCAGVRMTRREPKYRLPLVRARTGQIVSIGGLLAVEFPPLERAVPIHMFVGMGGFAHAEYARAMSGMEKLREINASTNPAHLKMRVHDNLGLELEPLLSFYPAAKEPKAVKPQVVVQNLGYLQPFVFGALPEDYRATVWAPRGTGVGLRKEVLPFL